MDIGKFINDRNSAYQITVARSILSFSRASAETQAQLLESYKAIIAADDARDARDAREDDKSDEKDLSEMDEDQLDEMWAKEDALDDEELGIDEIMDDPRHGQADPINRGDY